MYIRKMTKVRDRVYVEKVFSARYGDQSIPGPRKKLTRDAVKRSQAKERAKKLQWLIEENFELGDWSVTLTFRKENRTTDKEVLKGIKAELMKELRKLYRKAKTELKYIIVTEKLKSCVHFHVILNDIPKLAKELTRIWTYGRVYTSSLYESDDGFAQLASYLIKEEKEKGEQSYTRSRNLRVPETKVEVIDSKQWRKEPKPKKGYYIQKGSITDGISNLTGYRYQYYTMIRYQKEIP